MSGQSQNVVVGGVATPRALFAPTADEVARLREAQKRERMDIAEQGRMQRLWGKVRMAVGVTGWAIGALATMTAYGIYHRQLDHHHFTVLNDSEQVATVYESFWDVPESKREFLILGTAAQYVRSCEGYAWAEAQSQYDYCAGLSAGQRRKDILDRESKSNPQRPEALLGQYGSKRILTGKPVRTGPSAITVPYFVVIIAPNANPVCGHRLMRLVYVPVKALPSTLHLQYATADVAFIGATQDLDPSMPTDAVACQQMMQK